jgi:hypothetical protein
MRRFLSSACFTFGSIWAAAGILKAVFGVRLTLPLLPPLGLEQVAVIPSLVIGLVLFAAGAVLGRAASTRDARKLDASLEPAAVLGDPLPLVATPVRASMRQPNEQ